MQLSYRKLFTDLHQIDYSVVRNGSTLYLCLQGELSLQKRLHKAFKSAELFYPLIPENTYKPISFANEERNNLSTALFLNVEGGFISDFFKVVPKEWQYACGKKTGRALNLMHSAEAVSKPQNAKKRHASFMEKLAEYVAYLPHFKNDRYAMDALSSRYDNFSLFKPVMRYGALRHQKLMISRDSQILFLPSSAYGPGDCCEDFALLEFESAGLYPVFCAGVIDGYFSGLVPSKFWMHFALYSALYSLWKAGKYAQRGKDQKIKMQLNVDRIAEDFNHFEKPVPNWYLSDEVQKIKEKLKYHPL